METSPDPIPRRIKCDYFFLCALKNHHQSPLQSIIVSSLRTGYNSSRCRDEKPRSAMAVKITVPSLSKRVVADVETSPVEVEKWVRGLPLLNLSETARKLFSTLNVHNRIQIDRLDRLKILEFFREPVQHVCRELQKQYVGMPLPMPERIRSIAERNREFQTEMSAGYKRLVLESGEIVSLKPKDRKRDIHVVPIQRAIRYLTHVLSVCYESYTPYPKNLWREIHELYRYADSLGIVDVAVDDKLSTAESSMTVADAYKQALLLDLCDPYHLAPRNVIKVYQYLERSASLADILPSTASSSNTRQFLIHLSSDRAGIIKPSDTVPDPPDDYRLLNPIKLAQLAQTQLNTLQQKQVVADLKPEFLADGGRELLRQLINSWGVNPQRVFRRNSKSKFKIDIAVGINTIAYLVNGGQKLMPSSTFVGPIPQVSALGARADTAAQSTVQESSFTSWDVQDESAGGLAFSKRGSIKTPVRVGDLIGIRAQSPNGNWSVGVVRWARSANPSEVEFGAQRLAPSVDPILIKTLNDDGKESDFLSALRIPEVPQLKQSSALVTHRGIYQMGRLIIVDDGAQLQRITATDSVEMSGAFEQFQFRIENN